MNVNEFDAMEVELSFLDVPLMKIQLCVCFSGSLTCVVSRCS